MTNRFDDKYDIRLAVYEEIPEIMNFVNDNWRKNHILATDRNFFEYEMVIEGKVNVLIAKDKAIGVIDGMIGFLPASDNAEYNDVWGVIWKTVPDAMPMLGMELMKRLKTVTGARTILGVGADPRTAVPLLGRIYHFYTSKMKHYYRLSDIEKYNIASISEKLIPEYDSAMETTAVELTDIGELNKFFDFVDYNRGFEIVPYKNGWYYDRRFFKHPVYKYNVWGLTGNDKKAVMVTRIQECNGSKVIRIVDYIGDASVFGGCGKFFDLLISGAEYIDFYFDGFDEAVVKKAGLVEVTDDTNIIPDYFKPYTLKNVEIHVVCSDKHVMPLYFKADGDQDRPN